MATVESVVSDATQHILVPDVVLMGKRQEGLPGSKGWKGPVEIGQSLNQGSHSKVAVVVIVGMLCFLCRFLDL